MLSCRHVSKTYPRKGARGPRRGAAARRLPGADAVAHRGHPRSAGRARTAPAETHRCADQRGPRRDRRGGGALSGPGAENHCRGCARRVVPVPHGPWPYLAGAPGVPGLAQRAHDTPRVRLDRGDAGGAGAGHCREHPAGRAGRAAGASDSDIDGIGGVMRCGQSGSRMLGRSPRRWAGGSMPRRLPVFYGWVIVAVAFVTMGLGVNARTAFSLLFPPILDEFGWERGTTAGAFSFGFIAAIAYAPAIGMLMDRFGPRLVIPLGAVLVSAGMILATFISQPWHLDLTMGVMVGGGTIFLSYMGHSLFLPYWFTRRR